MTLCASLCTVSRVFVSGCAPFYFSRTQIATRILDERAPLGILDARDASRHLILSVPTSCTSASSEVQ